ncbi:cytochrome P450 [Flavobacterium laiguense]|uniref:Cytochrome P450 n=1 Tax=Flavobacterium laiguense TaxID=2169409 RepID=A0A2U1JYB0_9FLAO|nr:cytochrome P450 [Flavobacterium laiguense]PWA10211.1 hypothetical protein DB891_05810 [Flavobacterium laiguense]
MDSESNIKWNPFSPNYSEDPYPHLKNCRDNNPVQRMSDDSYFIFDYKHVSKFLKEKKFKVHSLSEYLGEKETYIFKNVENGCPYLSKATELWPMFLNDDIHRKIRRAITKAFYSLELADLLNESLETTLGTFENKETFNLVDFCGIYINHFIKKALNIDVEEYEQIKQYSNLLAKSQELYIPKQVYQEINAEILSRKNVFKNSIFKDVILEETKGLNLDDDQLYSIMMISFMAAFETSKDNLSLGLYEILKNPELIEFILKSDTKELKTIIEEIFRFSTPLQYTIRINPYSINVGDCFIPENSKLYLCIASANRDEKIFTQPDELIPNRVVNPHLSFGAGAHQCIGATIARQEMEISLVPMLRFLKNYSVTDVKWSKQILMRTANTITVCKKS